MRLTQLFFALMLSAATASIAMAKSAPAATEIRTNDNREVAGRLLRNQLHIELEAREGLWYPETHDGPGLPVQAFGERGKPLRVPGPMIRVPEGTHIRAVMRNLLAVPLILHGFHARPGDAKATIELAPGERREISFEAGAPGTYFYWGATMQGGPVTGLPIYRDSALTGGFIVDPRGVRPDPSERVFMLTQWHENPALDDPTRFVSAPGQKRTFAINGLAWPYTERLTYDIDKPVRWRWINSSFEWHPLHLHGFYYDILSVGDAESDTALAEPLRPRVVTQRLAPGATMSIVWTPDRSGNWLFHCHLLDHIGPQTRLRPAAAHEPGEAHGTDHVLDAMSGLVLGVTVRERSAQREVAAVDARRRMKLFIQEQPGRFGEASALGYVLKTDDQEPTPGTVDIPGPLILLTRGEPTRIEIVNRTREETSVHWHGMELESYFDGVPGWGGDARRTTPPIRPGESFVALMTPPRAGTFIYHTHWHDPVQLSSGMYGPLVVMEPGATYDPATERMILLSVAPPEGKVADPLLINGRAVPTPLQMTTGTTYRLRLINITADNGNFDVSLSRGGEPVVWRAIAKDGADLPSTQALESKASRQSLTVGETRDYEFRPTEAGDLLFEIRNIVGRLRGSLVIQVR